jgi:hydroxyethylthiazole kinase-like uncharacterized protein yjeF
LSESFSLFLPSSSEMSEYDSAAIKSGIPSIELMERAGKKMSESILNRYINFSGNAAINVVILCGPGNNGGDGLVVGRLLKKRALNVQLIRIASEKYSNDNVLVADKFLAAGGEIIPSGAKNIPDILRKADIIIDALLGTGQKSAPKGEILHLINALNENKNPLAKIVALDLPTGVDGSSGNVYEPHIRANFTLTVEYLKRGMLQHPAVSVCGMIDTLKIGITAVTPPEFSLLTGENIPKIERRKANAHKGDFGHVLVIGGSSKYPGAPVLCSHAALRSGAGLVTYAALSSCLVKDTYPELMFRILKDSSGFFKSAYLEKIKKDLAGFSSVVIGPGLGQEKATGGFFLNALELLSNLRIPAVIDADGLNFLSDVINGKKTKKALNLKNCVLTPHPGEMSRLLGIKTKEVQADRYLAVKNLALKTGAVVVLKGACTVIYSEKSGFVNLTGNPYMASGGSGDVLAGMIASFIAQGFDKLSAAKLSVYLHGVAGDISFEKRKSPMLASDIIGQIPEAIARQS